MLLHTMVVARSNMCPFEMFSLQLTNPRSNKHIQVHTKVQVQQSCRMLLVYSVVKTLALAY